MGACVKFSELGKEKKKEGEINEKVCFSVRSGYFNSSPSGNNLFICFRPSRTGCQTLLKD